VSTAEDRFTAIGGWRQFRPFREAQYWTYDIPVPGSFRRNVTYLDIETEKVSTPPFFHMQNDEVLHRRWSAFLVGTGWQNNISIIERSGDEKWFLLGVSAAINTNTVAYCATRQFDEMVLKGRFTNARRAHEPEPYFPAMPRAGELLWRNLYPMEQIDRAPDIESRLVPKAYRSGKADMVIVHNLRDVVELIMWDGKPDKTCADWCIKVLTDTEFALSQTYKAYRPTEGTGDDHLPGHRQAAEEPGS
jgi:hypothetical protein